MKPTPGIVVPDFKTIAEFHPQFALAMHEGCPVRPDVRPLSVEFSSNTVGQVLPASFSEVISTYSIFCGAEVTIDPTNNLVGNALEFVSDYFQAAGATGITVTALVKGLGGDYSPISDETPLQAVPGALSAAAGLWNMVNPENIKARFTLAATAPAEPMTVWLIFAWLVLSRAEDRSRFLSLDRKVARQKLKDAGVLA